MLRKTILFALAISLTLWANRLNFADDWPGWRGPRQNGISDETDIPLRWSSEENVLWKLRIDGEGHSSPITWGDDIFVTAATRDNETRRLLRVDRNSGNVLWDIPVIRGPIEEMHRDNTAASATPVTDGERVYTVFCVGTELVVTATDWNGNTTWQVKAGEFVASHGFCSSLVLDGEQLLLSGLQDGDAPFIVSLDRRDGRENWRVGRPVSTRSYSTPYLCRVDGDDAFLLSGADQTIAYHRDSGERLFEVPGPASKTVSSIVICEACQLAFVCGGRDNLFLALRLDAQESNGKKERIAWTLNRGIPYMTSPLAMDGLLHIVSDEGVYHCYEAASGKQLQRRRAMGATRASMVATADRIYITEVAGKTTVIENNADWNVLAKNDLGEEIVASPAISNGDIVMRGYENLYLIRSK